MRWSIWWLVEPRLSSLTSSHRFSIACLVVVVDMADAMVARHKFLSPEMARRSPNSERGVKAGTVGTK